ncbi:ABC transporter permease [Bacillus taeanensis]|uniref:ABC transporter permease n=1 Tax=Bacillus taeanensis TaxID=273032 RepID=A0A366Y053_9BACI|nr:ABC transporter permease [Bacillus taeanensis]RBW71226.1 ABC transporter permease [Bacillus taeanensis]
MNNPVGSPATSVGAKGNKIDWKEKGPQILSKYGILFVLIAMMVVMSFLSDAFLTTQNLLNVVRQISFIGIVAMGVTMIIITTGIDLSSGSLIALVSIVTASFAHPGEYPLVVTILIGIGLGAAAGFINGAVTAKGKIPAFITTLGMMIAARGLALLYSDGRPIPNLSESFLFLGKGEILGIPFPIIVFIAVGIISHLMLSKTKFGKYTYAIGGNEQAARICGINVDRYKIMIYTYAGILSAIAGMMLTARISVGQPSMGVMFELDAIAAAVIGGTSLAGGVGTIAGTVIGALIIGVLNNGLDLLSVSSYWQQILKGVIIVSAVLIDARKNKKS